MIKEFKQILLSQTGTPDTVYFRYSFESEKYELHEWKSFEMNERVKEMIISLIMTILLNSNFIVESGAALKNSSTFQDDYELYIPSERMSVFVKFYLLDGIAVIKYFSFYAHRGYFLDDSGKNYSEQKFTKELKVIFKKLSKILL